MGQIHFCAGKSWCCCSYQQEMTFFLTVKSTQLRLFMSDSHGAMVSSWLRWKVSLKPKVFSFCLSGSCKALWVTWHSGHCSRTSAELHQGDNSRCASKGEERVCACFGLSIPLPLQGVVFCVCVWWGLGQLWFACPK